VAASTAALRTDIFLRQVGVIDPEVDGVPSEPLAGEHGDITE